MITTEKPGASIRSSSLSRNTVLALIAATLTVHLAEEFIAFPLFIPSLGRQLREVDRPDVEAPGPHRVEHRRDARVRDALNRVGV